MNTNEDEERSQRMTRMNTNKEFYSGNSYNSCNSLIHSFFILLTLVLCGRVFAQEDGYRMGLGPGVEWNMNADRNFAAGAALGADYNFLNSFATGLSVGVSGNFTVFTAIETAAMFRWYFLGGSHRGLFTQADAGLFLYMEDIQIKPMPLGGLRVGYRMPLSAKFYIEPYARGGYPFAFSVGMSAGMFLLPTDGTITITATGDRPARTPERTERQTGRGTIYYDEEELDEATLMAQPTSQPTPGRYYIVRPGDTLWHAAIWAYGDAGRWREVAAANGHIESPDLIIPGQRLYIPPEPKKSE